MNQSRFFATWLHRQSQPGMLPTQWRSSVNILDRLSTADLISVMYNGDDAAALSALKILRNRFDDEMMHLEEQNYQGEAA